jgi:hypothetical protein
MHWPLAAPRQSCVKPAARSLRRCIPWCCCAWYYCRPSINAKSHRRLMALVGSQPLVMPSSSPTVRSCGSHPQTNLSWKVGPIFAHQAQHPAGVAKVGLTKTPMHFDRNTSGSSSAGLGVASVAVELLIDGLHRSQPCKRNKRLSVSKPYAGRGRANGILPIS